MSSNTFSESLFRIPGHSEAQDSLAYLPQLTQYLSRHAVLTAVRTLDEELGRVLDAAETAGYSVSRLRSSS